MSSPSTPKSRYALRHRPGHVALAATVAAAGAFAAGGAPAQAAKPKPKPKRFFRNVAGITMDLDGVERLDTVALGGADAVVRTT